MDQPEHEVPLAESKGADPAAVVPTKVLLVYGRSGQGQFARLLEEVHAVFVCLLGFFLGVEDGSRGVELDVSRQDCFRAVDEEEGRVVRRVVGGGPEAPEYMRELFDLASGCSLEWVDQPGPDSG